MTEAEKIGHLANLPRLLAQDTIHQGNFNPTNPTAVYRLYMQAYGNEELARRAQSLAAEALVEAKTNVQKK